jgi:hypothetical protein
MDEPVTSIFSALTAGAAGAGAAVGVWATAWIDARATATARTHGFKTKCVCFIWVDSVVGMFGKSWVRERWERWLAAGKLLVDLTNDEFSPFLIDAV